VLFGYFLMQKIFKKKIPYTTILNEKTPWLHWVLSNSPAPQWAHTSEGNNSER